MVRFEMKTVTMMMTRTRRRRTIPTTTNNLQLFSSFFFLFLVILPTNILPTSADDAVAANVPSSTTKRSSIIKATFDTPLFAKNVSHRQNVCERYEAYHNGTVQLQDALNGFALRPILSKSEYFPNDEEDEEPGLLVLLLDMIAERAGFTWRDSFAILDFPPPPDITYTDMLLWATDTYDIAIDLWDRSPTRIGLGVTFLEPWLDASVILIQKIDTSEEEVEEIVFRNYLDPFTGEVWILIGVTIVVAGLTHQLIQYLEGEHEGGSWWGWFSDSLYLSSINFSQNYEYEFESCGGRVFGVGLTLWAMIITASYTANLASLLVVQNTPPPTIGSIEEAIVAKVAICTWADTQVDEYIQITYPNAIRKPIKGSVEAYDALRDGECGLLAAQKDNWFTFKGDSRYNPDCNLEWVGRVVKTFEAGFAVKADAGIKCTSFIRDVLDFYLLQLINEGLVEVLIQRFREKSQADFPVSCGGGSSSSGGDDDASGGDDNRQLMLEWRRRMLEWSDSLSLSEEASGSPSHTNMATRWQEYAKRQLKASGQGSGAGSGSSADSDDDSDDDGGGGGSSALTFNEMLGSFILLWAISLIAVTISALKTAFAYWNGGGMVDSYKSVEATNNSKNKDDEVDFERSSVKIISKEVNFDWAVKYAQMTDKEKQLADALFGRKVDNEEERAPSPNTKITPMMKESMPSGQH